MKIPFHGLDRKYHAQKWAYLKQIDAVLESGQLLQGSPVVELEGKLAKLTGKMYAATVGSATDALFFSLVALGIGPGDEVLVPDFSFIASASCILRAGATPVFVDVDSMGLMDVDDAASKVTGRTKAIIIVHLYGNLLPWDSMGFARDRGLYVIEDAAQALGSEPNVGEYGDVTCFSFDPTKVVSALGSGGAICTDEFSNICQICRYRYHGRAESGESVILGYNSQLPSISATCISMELDSLSAKVRARRGIASLYAQYLPVTWDLRIITDPSSDVCDPSFHKFVIAIPDRDALREFLTSAGVETKIHYKLPLRREPMFGIESSKEWMSDKLSKQVLSLPIYPELTEEEVRYVCGAIGEYYGD